MSQVTYAELLYGAAKSNNPEKTTSIVNQLIELIPVLAIDNTVSAHYEEMGSSLLLTHKR